jgi:hypothetical protein
VSSAGCPHFDTCSAPLCPLDPQSLEAGSWFGDEEICVRRDLRSPWIARQRKIVRATAGDPAAGSFTFRMLSRDFVIRRGLTGLDPDKGPPDKTEADWLKAHPGRRQLSDAQRAVLRARGFKKRPRECAADAPAWPGSAARETLGADAVSAHGGRPS